MKKLMIAIIAAMMFIVGCKRPPENIVARVNGVDITETEFEREYKNYKSIYEARIGSVIKKASGETIKVEKRALKKGVLEKLIMRQIIYQNFDKNGLEVDRAAFDVFMEEKINSLGGEATFNDFLKNIGISKAFFNEACLESYKKNLLIQKYAESVEITDDDIKQKYIENPRKYDSYSLELILVKDYNEALKISKINKDFKDLAILYSQDYETALDGGVIEKYHLGDYEEQFDSMLLELEIGEVSRPIEVDKGFYIIKLISKNIGFMNAKEEIKTDIIENDFAEHIKDLRKDAEVKIYIDLDN